LSNGVESSMKIFRDDQADTKYIKNNNILILGYGSQGRAFGLNLRDSGLNITICLPPKSESTKAAGKDNLPTISPTQIDARYDFIIFLIPDHIHGEFFRQYIINHPLKNATLVFAHAYSIHFKIIEPPADSDVILVAPHGPGVDLRSKYLDNTGLTCFVAKYQDKSGLALKRALALAKAIGSTRAGAFLTTFEHEVIGDIFGEQALLCGGLSELIVKSYKIMIQNGIPPENAYLETIHQIDLLAALIKNHGIYGMSQRISKTAQYGMLCISDQIIDDNAEERLGSIFEKIESGDFAHDWQNEYKSGLKNLDKYLKTLKGGQIEETSRKMRKIMGAKNRK